MTIEEKAESLYAYFDDLLARDLTLDGSTTSEDITEFGKDCARRVCSEVIVFLDKMKKQLDSYKSAFPDKHLIDEMEFWYSVRKALEDIRD